MRITAIRIRKLRSHQHGYGHDAAEIEAAVEDGDDPAVVAETLHAAVEAELYRANRKHDALRSLSELNGQIATSEHEKARLERICAELKADVARQRAIIAAHEKLAGLAKQQNLPGADNLLDDGRPF